jgi:TRAP-type C4-dicarboxylate transport system permease small subunit
LFKYFTWRMAINTYHLYTATFPQTTMILRIPLWWGYAAATLFMALLAIVCLFTVWRSLAEALGKGEPAYEPS